MARKFGRREIVDQIPGGDFHYGPGECSPGSTRWVS